MTQSQYSILSAIRRKSKTLQRCLFLLCFLCSIQSSKADIHDDRRWSKLFGLPGIQSPPADTLYTRDSLTIACLTNDGSTLYIGGRFDAPSHNIIAYSFATQKWQALGKGLDSSVRAIAMYQGMLVAAGFFVSTDATPPYSHIARYYPATAEWQSLGLGINGNVTALCVYHGELYAAGSFSVAGNKACRNIARWNGSEWHSLGSGISNGFDGKINALCVFNDQLLVAGELLDVAGDLHTNHIAAWDGQRWQNAETMLGLDFVKTTNKIYGLSAADSMLAIVGHFDSLSYNGGRRYTPDVIVYDGHNWSSPFHSVNDASSGIRACSLTSKDLYIIGDALHLVDNTLVFGVARWERGTQRWYSAGSGIADQNRLPSLRCLLMMGDTAVVGGRFTQAGGRYALNVAAYSKPINDWIRLHAKYAQGFDKSCALGIGEGELIAAGLFTHSGEIPVANIARWSQDQWNMIGSGMPGSFRGRTNQRTSPPWPSPMVYCVSKFNGEYIMGGDFIGCGNLTANNLLAFDGAIVHTLGSGTSGSTDWDRSNVSSLLVQGNSLYIGGAFTNIGSVRANSVARWDGTQWHAQARGIDSTLFYTPVSSLLLRPNGNVLAGGFFEELNSSTCNSIAEWNGTAWSCFDKNPNNDISEILCMAQHGNDLFIAGYFERHSGTVCNSIAQWDGTKWMDLNGGLSFGIISAMAVVGDELYIGGRFSGIGGVACNNVAVWNMNEHRWYALGSGLNGEVLSMAVLHDTVFFSGNFTQAGSEISNFVAAWLPERSVEVENTESTTRSALTLSPLPTQESLTITLSAQLQGASTMSIVDLLGREVMQAPFQSDVPSMQNSVCRRCINISSLPNGTYLCLVRSADQLYSQTFIVQH